MGCGLHLRPQSRQMRPPPQTAVAADEQQQSAAAASLRSDGRATVCNDDDSDAHSDRKNRGSDYDDEIRDIIQIEFRFISGEEACRPLSIMLDLGLSCGHLWLHLLDCGLDMENKKLSVGESLNCLLKSMAALCSQPSRMDRSRGSGPQSRQCWTAVAAMTPPTDTVIGKTGILTLMMRTANPFRSSSDL